MTDEPIETTAGAGAVETRIGDWMQTYGPIDDEAPTLAERQARYLAVRQHTLSTAGLPGPLQWRAQARYVLGEALELLDTVEDMLGQGEPYDRSAVRAEVADVVLSVTTLANLLGVTVEDCIDEKTEADRGRG